MFKTSPAWGVGAAALLGALASAPLAAQAQVYKCPQPNGTVGYQSTPCPTNARPPSHPTAAQLNADQAAKPKDTKPYDDPYANSTSSRQYLPPPPPPPPTWTTPAAQPQKQSTSSLVADVQARNKRDNQQQAYQEAHKNDKTVNMTACNSARHNLGVLNEQRAVFSYDNKGNRVFVDDKDRAATIADTQRTIAANCP